MVIWSLSQWKAQRGSQWSIQVHWSNCSINCSQRCLQSNTASEHTYTPRCGASCRHWSVTDDQDGQSLVISANVPPTWQGSAYQARQWADTVVNQSINQSINHGHSWSMVIRMQVTFIVRSLCVVPTRSSSIKTFQ